MVNWAIEWTIKITTERDRRWTTSNPSHTTQGDDHNHSIIIVARFPKAFKATVQQWASRLERCSRAMVGDYSRAQTG